MKTSTFLLLAMVVSTQICDAQRIQPSEVPSAVAISFKTLYPSIRHVVWGKSKWGTYEAEFKQNNKSIGVTLDSLGNFKEREMDMKVSDLAKEIHDYVAKYYKDYKITEAAQITYADGKPMFEAEITSGKASFDLLFDGSYKFIKKGHF